jgi:hypothetical protein
LQFQHFKKLRKITENYGFASSEQTVARPPHRPDLLDDPSHWSDNTEYTAGVKHFNEAYGKRAAFPAGIWE